MPPSKKKSSSKSTEYGARAVMSAASPVRCVAVWLVRRHDASSKSREPCRFPSDGGGVGGSSGGSGDGRGRGSSSGSGGGGSGSGGHPVTTLPGDDEG